MKLGRKNGRILDTPTFEDGTRHSEDKDVLSLNTYFVIETDVLKHLIKPTGPLRATWTKAIALLVFPFSYLLTFQLPIYEWFPSWTSSIRTRLTSILGVTISILMMLALKMILLMQLLCSAATFASPSARSSAC